MLGQIRLDSYSDFLRIFRIPVLIALESAKFFMFIDCGCQFDELNNWVRTSIIHPWYWRTASDGTRFVAGPYSTIWYFLNEPARLGYYPWMLYLFFIDVFLSVWMFRNRSWKFLLPFIASSVYFYNVDPVDFFPFIFSVLGMFSPLSSAFALLIKIPWDAPSYVWSFILNNPYGIHEPGGWLRYGQLIAWFLFGLGYYLKRWRKPKYATPRETR